jgi:hypothetical protein
MKKRAGELLRRPGFFIFPGRLNWATHPARTYDVVPSGSSTDPEYGRAGLTETEAAEHHDAVVGIARYGDLLRPVADSRSEGFCKLIADRRSRTILGAHVLGEYSAETVQTVAGCMAAGMSVEQIAELQLAFPTFTEGVSMATQKIRRSLGVGRFPRSGAISAPKTDGHRPTGSNRRPAGASADFSYLTKTYPSHPSPLYRTLWGICQRRRAD